MLALMVYSVMFSAQGPDVKFLIVASIGHQIYILLLIRSVMIDLKQAAKRNAYAARCRQSSIRYSQSRDRCSVVLEPYRPRLSLVPLVVNETDRPKVTQETNDPPREPKATAIVHPPVKEGVYNETVVKVGAGEANDKEAKELTKETKGKEVKRKRSIFGRKEKVKKDESQETKEA